MNLKGIGIALVATHLSAAPQFEVASIKPANPSARGPGQMRASINTTPGLLATRSASLKELVAAAYALEAYQVSGSPGWPDSEKFAVEAKSANRASREQLLLMLRSLLADRFKLTFHKEARQLPVYALMVAKNGPRFHRLEPGTEPVPGKGDRLGRGVDLPWLVSFLMGYGSDRPVIDRTGLTGQFDLDLDMGKILPASVAEDERRGPSMFEHIANAVEGQLGLRLVPTKASIEVLVIDHAERPGEN